jgi:pimeloyl-ACP methyl ester carboxylesterase
MSARPTVVLVHGAFADASGWAGVDAELANDDVDVIAPPNLLRGVASDAAYIGATLDQLDGPVVLVGHSYGGAVITTAGLHDKVAALVYVAGYAPDEGESVGQLQGRFPDSPLAEHLRFAPTPGGGTDVSVDPAFFPHIFAADVPLETTGFLARSQRPLSAAVFEEPTGRRRGGASRAGASSRRPTPRSTPTSSPSATSARGRRSPRSRARRTPCSSPSRPRSPR